MAVVPEADVIHRHGLRARCFGSGEGGLGEAGLGWRGVGAGSGSPEEVLAFAQRSWGLGWI